MARLFVDNLTVIDFSYLDFNRGVVGESLIVDIELVGKLNEQGMVFDFAAVKKQIKQFIDNEVDHRLLVPNDSPECNTAILANELAVEFPLKSGAIISYKSPKDAVLLIDTVAIKPTHIAKILQEKISALLPDNVINVVIKLRNEEINSAYFQYTHGLQMHLGQCQRIAHGHRSRIEIKIDSKRNQQLEIQWANILADSYIATDSHIIEEYKLNNISHTRLFYIAEQGEFAITLPTKQLFKMPYVSTVENIAIYLSELIANEHSGLISVKAFEGLNKGAFGEVKSSLSSNNSC